MKKPYYAQLLLQQVLSVNRAWLITHEDEVLTTHQQVTFETLLQRRLTGEPLAYILGSQCRVGKTFFLAHADTRHTAWATSCTPYKILYLTPPFERITKVNIE